MRKGKSYKEQYSAYKAMSTRAKNKAAKLARHLKKHPNDTQSAQSKIGAFRTKPNTSGNFPEKRIYLLDAAGHKIAMPVYK